METLTSAIPTNSDSGPSSNSESQTSVKNTSWEKKSHAEKAAFLGDVFIEKIDVASGTIQNDPTKTASHISARPTVSKPEFKKRSPGHSSPEYLQIIRSHYMKLILQSIRNVQPYAETPNASVYVHKILHTIRDYEEKSPDDAVLEVLFAFYDALAYESQWTTYSAAQFEKAEEILGQITRESIKSKDIEKAMADFDRAGFNILPFEFSLEDDVDTI